ncbi:unnamed protein product [Peronospora belbahrii]|uniref:Protein transport protein sec16 n=1 Tax=Peronospora belbahrii TaxID=622444 RepID=A0ABN8D6A0_9STRA|nr:unnamed protein product [Peronospora belbahrii]
MDGAHGFFCTAGFSSDKDSLPDNATRSKSVSVGTRLRQKSTVGVAAPEDFFASLGVDTTSHDRTGSSASTDSNQNYNSMVMRRSSASGVGSSTPTSSSSAWRRSPIGGLRATAIPPLMPLVGSLSVSRVNSSMITTTTASTATTNVGCEGLNGSGFRLGVATAAPVATAKTNAGSTQLFTMEDAEDLYSNDGWNCDSPSTVLLNSMDETETTSTAVPVLAVAKTPEDEVAWDDADDAFASSVAKATMMSPNAYKTSASDTFKTKVEFMIHQASPELSADHKFATKSCASTQMSSHETKSRQTQSVSAVLPPPTAVSSTSCSSIVTNSTFERTGHFTSPVSVYDARSAPRRTQFEYTRPPAPSPDAPSSFLSSKSTHNIFETTNCKAHPQAALCDETFVSRRPHEQDELWDEDLHQQKPADTGSETIAADDTTTARATAVTTMKEIWTDTFVTPPVEITSPGGDAGKFWGDVDEDELFDHDEHATEVWDESTKDLTSEPKSLALSSSHKESHVKSTTHASSSQSTSISIPYQPPPLKASTNVEESNFLVQEGVSASNYFLSRQSEKVKMFSQEELIDQLPDAKMSPMASSIEPSLVTPSTMHNAVTPSHLVESTARVKEKTLLRTECSPFSSAFAESSGQENDPNESLKAPRSARSLHTPTGTGGPFGRVHSPQGNDSSFLSEGLSGTDVNEAGHDSIVFESGEKSEASDSYTESSVRWDPLLFHDGGHVRMSSGEQANDDQIRHNTHHGPSNEEERDSVVAFLGEDSFFPSTGRPSSLYGGSQSSFASHRMYQSSVASTDHEGSSIASFGVSSAGATFGGSERVSEGGAFSDGTVSESPSMVDSSNASTAFGTDFPSVSEGQFSAPGTTIGGSDNASDGGFSDDNASETISMCGSVNTNPRFLSEFGSSGGPCVMATVAPCDMPEPFTLSTPDSDKSVAATEESAPVLAAPIFDSNDASSDASPFASSLSTFPPSQHSSTVSPALADSSIDQSEGAVQEDNVQSAASLFGVTTGSDVQNPFDSFRVPPAVTEAKIIDEHELPTIDAGDLFGSQPSSSGFENSFARPTQNLYSSSYQPHDQGYKQARTGSNFAAQTSTLFPVQGRLSFPNSNDRSAEGGSFLSTFRSQHSSNYNRADPFASQGARHCFDNSAPSAAAVFDNGGNDDKPSVTRGVSSYLGGDIQAPVNALSDRSINTGAAAAGHFGQQFKIANASHGGSQSYNHYGLSVTTAYPERPLMVVSNHAHQSGAYAETNTFCAQSHGQINDVAADECTKISGGFESSSCQPSATSFTSNTALRHADGFGRQNHPGRTSDTYSHQSTNPAFSGTSRAQQSYGSQQIGQRSTVGTANIYSRHRSTAKDIERASSAQSSYSKLQDNSYLSSGKTTVHGPVEGLGDHLRSSSSASTDAFFGRSPSAADPISSASDAGGERVMAPSATSIRQQPPVLTHPQPSFLRSGSNASSNPEQQGTHLPVDPTEMRPSVQLHDSNASYRLNGDANLSRYGSSSPMSRYGNDTTLQPHLNLQQSEGSTSAHPSAGASFSFGVAPSVTSREMSSGFGSTKFQDSSKTLTSYPQASTSSDCSVQTVPGSARQEQDSLQEWGHRETSDKDFAANSATFPVSQIDAISRSDMESLTGISLARSKSLQQHEANCTVGSPVVSSKIDSHTVSTVSTIASAKDVHYPDGFLDSGSNAFSETSRNFFSSSAAPQATASMSYRLKHKGCDQEQLQHQDSDDAASSLQFANSTLSYDSGLHTSGGRSGSYFDSRVPGASAASSASHSQQQPEQPQQFEVRHAVREYDYRGGIAQRQPQGASQSAAGEYEYGVATRYEGYGQKSTPQMSPAAPHSVLKTSNKYKDPCVAPPSCLASFGFGGNVVTMFPTRKLQSNAAGSSFHNSFQGAAAFDNRDGGVLCKGPVNVFSMDQLHPKDNEFEQMDIFPGPLTEDVSGETILECLDNYLRRSEVSTRVDEENDRLLLGVLRVLVKCNGKLRSDPGILNSSDPDSPEAQLIALLSESSKRRNKNERSIIPRPRKAQSTTPPDLMLKHANDLRELLLVGDRKGAVSSAMTAQMWPEAILIASYTDKDEYRRVLRTYLDEYYATGDPCRVLFMSFADQQEKSVQEPKCLLQANVQQPAGSLILSNWVSHAQVLLSNRTADTNNILTELGDRLWGEVNAVAAAHTCYLLAGIQVDAPTPSSKLALLGGDHRTPAEARSYVSPAAVQRTEIYEWAQKHAKGASANLMIPFQGYKLIYAMLLADHGKLDTAFKYVTSMLAVIKAVTATMKPGTSMYLDGMKNQLTVLDDRLRQHLGQDRVASAAATSRDGSLKQGGKWGLGSALSIMGKIVTRVVEGNEAGAAPRAGPSASSPGGMYEMTAESYSSTPSMAASASSPTLSYPQQHAQQTPPSSLHEPAPMPASFYGHATPPASQSNASVFPNDRNRASVTSPAGPYSRPGVAMSGPYSGNGHFASQQQQLSGAIDPCPTSGPGSQKHDTAPRMRSQHSIKPPGSNHSTQSNSSFGMAPHGAPQRSPQHQQQQQSPPSQVARKSFSLDMTSDTSFSNQLKTLIAGPAAKMAASLPPTGCSNMDGPASDKGKASPMFKDTKKSGRSKTPPPSGSGKGSGWLSGLSSFIATKMNPEVKVAKLGEQMEAYFDEDAKRWVFPGESAPEETATPSAPPTGPLPDSAPGSSATGVPPAGTNSAPGSISSGPAPSNDPLAALMAPPPSRMLMKKDPLAAMMMPPSHPGMHAVRRGNSTALRKPPRPQCAVFKPTTGSLDEQSG